MATAKSSTAEKLKALLLKTDKEKALQDVDLVVNEARLSLQTSRNQNEMAIAQKKRKVSDLVCNPQPDWRAIVNLRSEIANLEAGNDILNELEAELF